jgi:dihydroorotase
LDLTGIRGLETAVGVTFTELVATGLMDLSARAHRWTTGPARVLGLPEPSLHDGAPADIVLLDLNSKWTVHARNFLSKSRNTPFEGRELIGRAVRTIYRGKTVWTE